MASRRAASMSEVASIGGFIPSLATLQCISIFVIILLFVYLTNKYFFFFLWGNASLIATFSSLDCLRLTARSTS